MKIPEKSTDHYLPQGSSRHPNLNTILKHKGQPYIHVIKKFINDFQVFIFHQFIKILPLKKIEN